MKRCAILLMSLVLLLVSIGSCTKGKQDQGTEYVLYFLTDDGTGHGAALRSQPYPVDEGAVPTPGDLLRALVKGPTAEGLRTPFPRGVTLQSWNWDEDTPGNVQVTLSEQYGGLTDISLTLADYCIVLTLSQLDGVESVEILSQGHTASYRSHQLLSAEEVLLMDEGENRDFDAFA